MEIISRDDLKAKIDRGDDFKLVMVLGEWHYRAKHIPGSLNITSPDAVSESLRPEDEIVVYCSYDGCPASKYAYMILERAGYKHVSRYAGGIADWEDAGLPLEGELVE